MKRVLRVAALALGAAIPLYAAMSDTSALKKAKATWGDVAMIGQKRNMVQSNWSKLVGFASPKCDQEFTVVGSGFNTWDAAFADADMHPAMIFGPFKQTITLRIQAWDNVSLKEVAFWIDGNSIAAPVTPAPGTTVQNIDAMWDIDTTQLTNGYHVMCGQATDDTGLVGKSYIGAIFKVDQAQGVAGVVWFPGEANKAARPSFNGFTTSTFTQK